MKDTVFCTHCGKEFSDLKEYYFKYKYGKYLCNDCFKYYDVIDTVVDLNEKGLEYFKNKNK